MDSASFTTQTFTIHTVLADNRCVRMMDSGKKKSKQQQLKEMLDKIAQCHMYTQASVSSSSIIRNLEEKAMAVKTKSDFFFFLSNFQQLNWTMSDKISCFQPTLLNDLS